MAACCSSAISRCRASGSRASNGRCTATCRQQPSARLPGSGARHQPCCRIWYWQDREVPWQHGLCCAAAAGSTTASSLADMPQEGCSTSRSGKLPLGLIQTLVEDRFRIASGAELA